MSLFRMIRHIKQIPLNTKQIETLKKSDIFADMKHVLFISTSEWVLHMQFTGRNQLSDAKTIFPSLTEHCFCYFLRYVIQFMTLMYAKSYYSVKKLISTSKRLAEHQFAGQNRQQTWHDGNKTGPVCLKLGHQWFVLKSACKKKKTRD